MEGRLIYGWKYRMATSSTGYRRSMSRETTYAPFSNDFMRARETDRKQIKYLRVPDEIIDLVKEQQSRDQGSGYRGGRGGAGRGDHRGGGDRGRGRGAGRGRGRGRGS